MERFLSRIPSVTITRPSTEFVSIIQKDWNDYTLYGFDLCNLQCRASIRERQ